MIISEIKKLGTLQNENCNYGEYNLIDSSDMLISYNCQLEKNPLFTIFFHKNNLMKGLMG